MWSFVLKALNKKKVTCEKFEGANGLDFSFNSIYECISCKDVNDLRIMKAQDQLIAMVRSLEGLEMELEKKNYISAVTTTENGLRAMEHLGLVGDAAAQTTLEANDMKINLIITDYYMPGMTGYELRMKIKESPSLKKIPVVIMSSENIPTRIKKCLEDRAEEFMLKPLQQSDVLRLRNHVTETFVFKH
ncbi:hypothetical protein J5N97_020417 [Dioscorea zingiberensis]|uniref:Response regulatory domain-containing protein n=1 Tax=Dioscorea zingiberensis TaxID=325984 RepID=A0A9D5CH23_9LILI|nr:hypothetical protein J5N97_020417 [Dioscorea zingiberensis]